jgi:hypothetical protein
VKIGTDAASGGPAAAWSRRRRYAGRNPLLRGSGARGGVGVGGSEPGLGTTEASSLPWILPAVELGPANCSASASCWSFRRPWSSRGVGELRRRGVDLEVGPVHQATAASTPLRPNPRPAMATTGELRATGHLRAVEIPASAGPEGGERGGRPGPPGWQGPTLVS